MKHLEYQLQKDVCRHISLQHPKVLFLSDTIGNVKLTKMQAARNKAIQKTGFKCTDVIILQPNKNYKGLFIELKIITPFKINGELKAGKHLREQQESINRLNDLGYKALFAWEYVNITKLIDSYLKDV